MITALLFAAALNSTPIPLDAARRVFEEARLASDEDGAKLWGKTLYGPTIFVDPQTRFVVANQADLNGQLEQHDGVWTATLPPSATIANTAVEWSGIRWTMVMWQALGDSPVEQRELLLHESFHRIQTEAGFPMTNPSNAHMATLDGRYWLLLELRALAAALRTSGEERAAALRDAVLFRNERRSAADQHSHSSSGTTAALERSLENNEGLAEYTGVVLRGTSPSESRRMFSNRLDHVDRGKSFVRSFAYDTGPAYGLLLDQLAPVWRKSYRANDDMALAALKAAGGALPDDAASEARNRAARYDSAALRESEEKRDREERARIAAYRARLVDGPVLEVPMGAFSFDPNTVVPLEGAGTAYPTLDVSGDWGTLTAKDGVLIASDFRRITVAAPPAAGGNPLAGPGWTLTLKPGWKLVPGKRKGDYRIAKE